MDATAALDGRSLGALEQDAQVTAGSFDKVGLSAALCCTGLRW
jgi:hypothetical protein